MAWHYAIQLCGGLAAAALFCGMAAAARGDERRSQPVKINQVLSATLKVEGGALTVTAVGQVPTGGYTKPTLTRVTYIRRPPDGIQDYTFQATPPDGPATQVISEVKASDTWPAMPAWLKGVRIHGIGQGVLVKMLEAK